MEIKIKKLNNNAIVPKRGSGYAAGYDLYACTATQTIIAPHQTVKFDTGLAFELPENTFGAIFARSDLSTKQGVRPSTCVSVIDADYRGHVTVPLHNDSNVPQVINPMERIAQLVLMPFIPMEFDEVDTLGETVRGDDGFGSTGKCE